MNTKKNILFFISVFSLFLFQPVLAASNLSGQITTQINVAKDTAGFSDDVQDPRFTIVYIIQIALSAVAIVFMFLIFYGGYLYIAAHGDEEQIKKAGTIIRSAIIGIIIIFLSYSITIFVGTRSIGSVNLEYSEPATN